MSLFNRVFGPPKFLNLVSTPPLVPSADNEGPSQREDPTKKLPIEVIGHIFSFLHPKEVLNNATICRRWNTLVGSEVVKPDDKAEWLCDSLWEEYGSQLGKIFPRVRVLDYSVWIKCFGLEALQQVGIQFTNKNGVLEFSGTPACTKAIILGLNRLLAIPTVAGSEGDRFKVTLLTMPGGLSLYKMVKLARTPQSGTGVSVSYPGVGAYILNPLGNNSMDKTCLVAFTNSTPKECLGRNPINGPVMEQVLEAYACQLPSCLEVVTGCLITFIHSSTETTPEGTAIPPIRLLQSRLLQNRLLHSRLHEYDVIVYAYCKERFERFERFGRFGEFGATEIVVGGFGNDGLHMEADSFLTAQKLFENCGALALMKFVSSGT